MRINEKIANKGCLFCIRKSLGLLLACYKILCIVRIFAKRDRYKIDLQNFLKRASNQINFIEVENRFRFSETIDEDCVPPRIEGSAAAYLKRSRDTFSRRILTLNEISDDFGLLLTWRQWHSHSMGWHQYNRR